MKSVLLIGLGYFGKKLAKELSNTNNDVLGIDIDEEKVEAAMPYLTDGQIGNCTNEDFLKSIGVDNFDLCIVAIGNKFQQSLEVTYLLKKLRGRHVIAVAYQDIQEEFLLRNGADNVINPDKNLAEWTAIRFVTDNILDYVKINDDCGLFEVTCPTSWDGKTLLELDVRKKYGLSVVGIKENDKTNLSISVKKPFAAGEILLVIGQKEAVAKVFN